MSNSSTVAFTVTNSNMAANAMVLLEDLSRIHPNWDRRVISSEPINLENARRLDAKVMPASNIGMGEFLAFRIGFPESFILKAMIPWAFNWLFEQGYRKAIFFGPQVRCYSPLIELSRGLFANSAVLIPRVLQPHNDSLTPNDSNLRTEGHFDSDLVGFSNTENSKQLLLRWMDSWRNLWFYPDIGGSSDPTLSILELMPSVLDRVFILCAPGYQVSRWNLHDREMTYNKSDATWELIAGSQLRTMNFLGLIDREITGSQLNRNVRPAWMRRLISDYLEKIQNNGYPGRKISHSEFQNRIFSVPSNYRQAALKSSAIRGALFNAESMASVRKILREFMKLPDGELPDFPWLLAEATRQVPELAQNLVGLTSTQQHARLRSWYVKDGSSKFHLPLSSISMSSNRKAKTRPTINVFGYFTAQNGLAEAARSTARALSHPVSDCHNVNYLGGTPSPYAHPGVALSLPHPDPTIDIVHLNCSGVPLFLNTHGEVWNRSSYKIGFWLWELETLPPQALETSRLFNEIWCTSEFNCACFRQLGNIPIRLAPLLVNPSLPALARANSYRLPESPISSRPYLFLTMADFFSCPERKNPLASVQAYVEAFPRDNGETGLLVKVSNTGVRPDYFEMLQSASRGRRDVQFLLENLNACDLAQLLKRSTALVSLHTTEGYGLPIAEAMALGRPVIATNYGGNVDFCKGANTFLIDYKLVTLDRQIGPYEKGTCWASPNLEEAARAFRSIYKYCHAQQKKFKPQVIKFNRDAQEQYVSSLAAATQRSTTVSGVRLEYTRYKIAIFGAGAGGEQLYKQLFRRHDLVCFFDNDSKKIGNILLGLPILSPRKIKTIDFDKILIGSQYQPQIYDQLISLGVSPEKLSLHSQKLSDIVVVEEKILQKSRRKL